jgi:hypothetical protein
LLAGGSQTGIGGPVGSKEAAFIVLAHKHMGALLDEIERLRRRRVQNKP